VVVARHVEHAVDDEWRRLKAARGAGLEGPLRGQLIDVLGRELCQRTMSLAAVVAAIGEPARWILQAVQQSLRPDEWRTGLRGQRDRHGAQNDRQKRAHSASERN